MGLEPINAGRLDRARRDFLESGIEPGDFLAPHIRRSWVRSRDAARQALAAEPLSRLGLSERRAASEWLVRCAQPELDALAEHVVAQGCVVILSDAAGLILDEVGSPEFLPKARRVALAPGVEWSERQRGTNAIGTALVERVPVMVLGPEHLLAENAAIGCAAAPILSERGDLVGVLDVSGESVRVDVHALGLVRMAAAQVEHRMMSQRHRAGHDEDLVHFHWRAGLVGTPREGLLSIVDGRIAGLNRAAAEMLGGGWSRWLGVSVEQVFGDRWRALRDAPGLFTAHDRKPWAVAVDARRAAPGRPLATVNTATADATKTENACGHAPGGTRPAPAAASDVLLDRARRVLDAGLPVLVSGETGVGKEVFARRLHAASRRAAGPMVAVNCAAMPETLIEAELFGYEEGAFTGARRRGNTGRIREAHGGVLFLDEIGDMPLALQTRLLRVLEERRVRPLGGSREIEVDFALVCASHRDLAALVREGRFREDLLYRLRGFEVALPPLRERPDRRELILRLFDELGGRERRNGLSDAALARLSSHRWPGNVRELVATLRAALALADPGTAIEAEDIALTEAMPSTSIPDADAPAPHPPASMASGQSASQALAWLTEQAIDHALQQQRGNVAAAARALGIHRSTLYRHLERRKNR